MTVSTMNGLPMVRLGYLATVQSGITIDGSRDAGADAITLPYLRVANVQAGYVSLDSITEVSVSSADAKRSTLRSGDVLMTEGGDLDKLGRGTVWRGEIEDCLHQNHVFAVRPLDGLLDPDFLSYLTQSAYSRAYFESTGVKTTNLASTSSAKIRDFRVPLFSLTEQRRIADFLDVETARIDRLVGLRSTSIDLLKERLAANVDNLVRGGGELGQVPADYKPLGMIPAKWRQGRLRNIECDVQTGPFGSQLHAGDYVEGGWPVINPANITPQGLRADPLVTVDDYTRKRLSRHVLKSGDVVFARRGELGRAGVIGEREEGWICGTGALRVRFATRGFDSGYFYRYLTIPAVRHYFEVFSVGSTMANLNSSILLGMPLLIPSMGEQAAIASACAAVEKETQRAIAMIGMQRTLLAERRLALITAAVTGQLDVTTARGADLS